MYSASLPATPASLQQARTCSHTLQEGQQAGGCHAGSVQSYNCSIVPQLAAVAHVLGQLACHARKPAARMDLLSHYGEASTDRQFPARSVCNMQCACWPPCRGTAPCT